MMSFFPFGGDIEICAGSDSHQEDFSQIYDFIA